MKNVNPQQAADNWVAGMSRAGEKFKAGVMSVTEAPTAKAAAAVQRQVDGVIRAMQSGKTQRRLQAVSLSQWQKAMNEKAAPRMASGAAAAKPKMANFLTAFLPHMQAVVAALPPRGDLETNIQRANAVMRGAAEFQYNG